MDIDGRTLSLGYGFRYSVYVNWKVSYKNKLNCEIWKKKSELCMWIGDMKLCIK